jgi:polyisoprenoid-binding protein YceI
MRSLVLAAALALVATSVMAAAPPNWAIDKGGSRLGFTAAMNGAPINGAFQRWDAQIAFDPANLPASHVVATIDTGSAKTGDQTRDEALPTGDWFSTKSFPRATFVSRKITAAGPGRYVAAGDLTIRNMTHPVALPFTLVLTGDRAAMTGALPIDRSIFGVGQGQWKTGEAVALKVQVNLSISAKRLASKP